MNIFEYYCFTVSSSIIPNDNDDNDNDYWVNEKGIVVVVDL